MTFDFNLILGFLYYDKITCIYLPPVLFLELLRYDRSVNKFKIYDCSHEFTSQTIFFELGDRITLEKVKKI